MRLVVKNVAKLESADIELKGITVVVGNNNTGKSTVGKILCSILGALYNLDERVHDLKRLGIEKTLTREIASGIIWDNEIRTEISAFLDGQHSSRQFVDGIEKIIGSESLYEKRAKICHEVDSILNIPQEELVATVLRRYFESVFNYQVLPLTPGGGTSDIVLTMNQQSMGLKFTKKDSSLKSAIKCSHRAFYLENPDIVSLLDSRNINSHGSGVFANELLTAIRHYDWNTTINPADGAIDDILNNGKMKAVDQVLNRVLHGEVIISREKGFVFRDDGLASDLFLPNLSMGIKSFALLQMLLKFNVLKSEDILVLDEPEIHLHPEWQLVYAEFIVLLQREYNLTILLASHSPDFIQAIRLFAKKYGTYRNVNAYLSYIQDNGMARFDAVAGEGWDAVFKKFMPTIEILTELRESTMELQQ